MSEDQKEYVTDALEMMGISEPRQIVTEVSGFIPVFEVVMTHYQDHMTALVFGRIWQYCGMSDGVCRATIDRIANDLQISGATIMRHIEKLEADGYIYDRTPERKNRPHEYVDCGKVIMKGSLSAIAQKNVAIAQKNVAIAESQLIKQDNTNIKKVSFTPLEQEQMKAKVYSMIETSKSEAWRGRELIRDNLLPLADWYNRVTGQEMTKKAQKTWWKALQDWQDEGLQVEHLQTAFDAQSKWRTVSDPNQLTKDASAVKAAGKMRVTSSPAKVYKPSDEQVEYVPAPERIK